MIKELIIKFNPIFYNSIWTEYKFLQVCLNFITQNLVMGVDITCHNDLMEICTNLIAGKNDNNYEIKIKILYIFIFFSLKVNHLQHQNKINI